MLVKSYEGKIKGGPNTERLGQTRYTGGEQARNKALSTNGLDVAATIDALVGGRKETARISI